VNPLEDTISKIDSISPIKGRILDTCMGLGYTAIMALENGADEVITVEKDRNVIEIAKINPWSEGLWGSEKIRVINGDIAEEIKKFRAGYFDRIIHDPPRFSLAGKLYSAGFYRELFRVLKENGKIYHYTGNPGERYRGKNFVSGVVKRLNDAGFRDIRGYEKGLGVIASKKIPLR
jgi:predicted methyltransferase